MIRVSWIKAGSTYRRMEGDITNMDKLPVGVYEVGINLSGWFLTKTADKFIFNYKVYDLQRGFLDHVKKTYDSTNGNLGVLFNGTRGTGKTVSAKVLANELNLPIILVKSMGDKNDGLISYLSSFNFDCIFFFDEFEKQFNESDCSILQIMDGVYNSEFRKVFLLTTNELNVNPNLLSRPSRIRYVREFGNLSKSVVEEYLDDNLKDNTGRDDLLAYIDTLTISTIDILKAIVEEVNIHGIEAFLEAKKFFNVEIASYDYRTIYGSIGIDNVKDNNYNVEYFLKDIYAYKNRYSLREKFNEDMDAAKNEKERAQIKQEYVEASHIEARMEYYTVYDVDKSWDKLKPNKDTFNDELVIGIDINNKVVITSSNGYVFFYLIENPSQHPSLYHDSGNEIIHNLNLL